jgi:hypothetical protein
LIAGTAVTKADEGNFIAATAVARADEGNSIAATAVAKADEGNVIARQANVIALNSITPRVMVKVEGPDNLQILPCIHNTLGKSIVFARDKREITLINSSGPPVSVLKIYERLDEVGLIATSKLWEADKQVSLPVTLASGQALRVELRSPLISIIDEPQPFQEYYEALADKSYKLSWAFELSNGEVKADKMVKPEVVTYDPNQYCQEFQDVLGEWLLP